MFDTVTQDVIEANRAEASGVVRLASPRSPKLSISGRIGEHGNLGVRAWWSGVTRVNQYWKASQETYQLDSDGLGNPPTDKTAVRCGPTQRQWPATGGYRTGSQRDSQ